MGAFSRVELTYVAAFAGCSRQGNPVTNGDSPQAHVEAEDDEKERREEDDAYSSEDSESTEEGVGEEQAEQPPPEATAAGKDG